MIEILHIVYSFISFQGVLLRKLLMSIAHKTCRQALAYLVSHRYLWIALLFAWAYIILRTKTNTTQLLIVLGNIRWKSLLELEAGFHDVFRTTHVKIWSQMTPHIRGRRVLLEVEAWSGVPHQLWQSALDPHHEVFLLLHKALGWVLCSQSLSPQLVTDCIFIVVIQLALRLLNFWSRGNNSPQESLVLCVNLDRLSFPKGSIWSPWSNHKLLLATIDGLVNPWPFIMNRV